VLKGENESELDQESNLKVGVACNELDRWKSLSGIGKQIFEDIEIKIR